MGIFARALCGRHGTREFEKLLRKHEPLTFFRLSGDMVELLRGHKHCHRSHLDHPSFDLDLEYPDFEIEKGNCCFILCATDQVSLEFGNSTRWRLIPAPSAVAATICKLVFWNRNGTRQKSDLDSLNVLICTQSIQCLSLISACALYLKPFVDSLESGFMRHDDIRRRGTDQYYGHASSDPSPPRSGISTSKRSRRGSQAVELLTQPVPAHVAVAIANDPHDRESESVPSDLQHSIKETRTFTVAR